MCADDSSTLTVAARTYLSSPRRRLAGTAHKTEVRVKHRYDQQQEEEEAEEEEDDDDDEEEDSR